MLDPERGIIASLEDRLLEPRLQSLLSGLPALDFFQLLLVHRIHLRVAFVRPEDRATPPATRAVEPNRVRLDYHSPKVDIEDKPTGVCLDESNGVLRLRHTLGDCMHRFRKCGKLARGSVSPVMWT